MSGGFKPMVGSYAHKAVTHLQSLGPRAKVASSALAAAIGVDMLRLTSVLDYARRQGALHAEREEQARGRPLTWSLGAAEPLQQGPQSAPRLDVTVTEHNLSPSTIYYSPLNRPCRWELGAGLLGAGRAFAFAYLDVEGPGFNLSASNLRILRVLDAGDARATAR